ncbi:esterase B1-like [Haematobia irritans]|uniref:esterase B1-like n=1 Tax=Haematobia irritans TaxID=7368 RepID=UPI003F4F47FE
MNYGVAMRTLEFKVNQWYNRLNDEDVIAQISTGQIRGSKWLSVYNKVYYSFERIPYALPPVGELRFRAPKPMTPWKNIKDCSWYGPKCMQINPLNGNLEGSEDCLFINVYTNNLKPCKLRPVMFWIHIGGLQSGAANREFYGPDYFIEKNVILITVQYRLGALGFLSMQDIALQTPGNAGLKDIILALRWVKENATCFGGDPENVTVFGGSAGAVAAHLLMMSENARGLFHRVILQSGFATCEESVVECSSKTYELAQKSGYKGENKEHLILKYLQQLPAEAIVIAASKCEKSNGGGFFNFGPCIEPYLNSQTVIYKPVEELLIDAWGNNIPLILGGNSFEGLFFRRKGLKNAKEYLALLETCAKYVPKEACNSHDRPDCIAKGLKLRRIHVKGDQPTMDDFYEIISFFYYWHPLQKTIMARLKYARKWSTFLYRFDFFSNKLINPYRLMYTDRKDDTNANNGTAHTEELSFLFSSVLTKPMLPQSYEYKCMKRMISWWTQFALTGNPNAGRHPDIKWDTVWNPQRSIQDNTAFKCLNIGDEWKFIDLPEMEQLKVWQSLYANCNNPETENRLKTKDTTAYAKSLL